MPYFIDDVNGNDGNTGLDFDNALKTVAFTLDGSGGINNDTIWTRRTLSEIPSANLIPRGNNWKLIGCPRADHVISSSDWTNGSDTVTVDDNDMVREEHQARYITAPNGGKYFIEQVVASNSIKIDREYAGATVTNEGATILADEDYDEFCAIDDSGTTIKVADWLADSDALACIDFNDAAYYWYFSQRWGTVKNFEFKDNNIGNGLVYHNAAWSSFVNCLFKQTTTSQWLFRLEQSSGYLRACTFEGGSGTPYGFLCRYGNAYLKDFAIYGCSRGIGPAASNVILENVSIDVADPAYKGLGTGQGGYIRGKDVRYNNGGEVSYYGDELYSSISIENDQKVLGAQKHYWSGGESESVELTTSPYPKLPAHTKVIKMTPNLSNYLPVYFGWELFDMPLYFEAGTYELKIWIYNDAMGTLNSSTAKDDIWLECDYVKTYDDTSEYETVIAESDETSIANAADANDWDSLTVNIVVAEASMVHLRLRHRLYSATGHVYVTPFPIITRS